MASCLRNSTSHLESHFNRESEEMEAKQEGKMSKKFGLTFGFLALFLAFITPMIMLQTFLTSPFLLAAFTWLGLILAGVMTIVAAFYKVSPPSYPNRLLPQVLLAIVALNGFSFLTKFFVSQFILNHFFLFFTLLFWMAGSVGSFVFATDVAVALLKARDLRRRTK
jgi:hypothetical protein